MDLVSIIIPCYNVSSFVDELTWVFEQTYHELEVVLVDDCSTDDTWQKLQAFKQQHADKRIIIAHQEKNAGPGAARNRGFALSSGQYVCFWDVDDRAYPQFVEKMLAKLQQEQADFVCCGFNTWDGKKVTSYQGFASELLAAQNEEISVVRQLVFLFNVHWPLWEKLMRRDFMQEHDIRFPEIYASDDVSVVYQLLLHAQKVAFIDEPYYRYYVSNSGSVMHRSELREQGFWSAMQFAFDYINKAGLVYVVYDSWNCLFLKYALDAYYCLPAWRRAAFLLKVRESAPQYNIVLTAKELPLINRSRVYRLLPKIVCFAKKREQMKQAYFLGQDWLEFISRLEEAEAELKE